MEASAPSTPSRGRRAKRATGDERESAILETLESLLAEQSFHEISIDDLARGAGISRPTFYFYFPSKEAVLLTLLDRIISIADAGTDVAQAMLDQDPSRFIREALNSYVTVIGAHRHVSIAGGEAAVTSDEVRKLWNQVRERWVEMIVAGIEAERERGAAPEGLPARELAIALLNMNEGVMNTTFSGSDPTIAEERIVEVLSTVWLTTIYNGDPPAPQA